MLRLLKCCTANWLCARQYTRSAAQQPAMKYLNVAEKHDAAKTIAGLLSNGTARRREGYSVYNKVFDFDATVKGKPSKMVMTSVSGHLLGMEFLVSYRNWRNVDPQALFDAPIRKACSEDYEPIKRTLEREIRGCQGLIIWTDCDREGENIGFEIIEVCKAVKPNIAVYRAIFSEITTASVRRALQQLATPDKRQSEAVDVRSELDLRTGAALTRFQTMRLQRLFPQKIADKLISYGSCQIPTLGFVAERYKEVEAFVSEPFWKIKVTHTIDDLTVDFNWARNRLFDKQACEDYLVICLADPKATVESVTVKPKNKWRPTPMDTVELEKLGSRKLKLSAKETMTIAEKLYTKGIISYPRTETNQFSKEIDLKSLVEQHTSHSVWGQFAQRVVEWGPNPRNGNKSDQAHPPIHPTKMVPSLDGNEGRVYELICRHFLACVSKDAVGSETVVHINIAGEKFTATGLCIYERNYLDVYVYEKWNAKQIHRYEQGQIFEPTEISMQEGATTAPPLLTEADLITLMEKHGIGTDATHADHINTIKERGYIGVVDKGCLVPGIIGMGLYEGYDAMQLTLSKPVLRAEFEADLKKICLGEKDPKAVLAEQVDKYKHAYRQMMEKVTAMDEKIAQRLNETPTAGSNSAAEGHGNSDVENISNRLQEMFKCPKCGVAPLALKPKKNQSGFLIGCLNFPDCKNVIWLPDECKEPSVLDETCATCGTDVKLLKFKFTNTYYKSMFNAPFGWYKTCLRCDGTFRNAFNINLDSVKRVGAIVGSAPDSSNTRPFSGTSAVAGGSNAAMGAAGTTAAAGAAGAGGNKTKKSTAKKPKGSAETVTAPKQRKKKTSTTTTTATTGATSSSSTTTVARNQTGNSNIRSYFTSAGSNQSAAASADSEAIAAEQLNGVALDDFFDSNDGFEDLMLEAEANIATTATASHTQSRTTTTRDTNHHGGRQATAPTIELEADIAAAFADDDDDDFANINWDTVEQGGRGGEESSSTRNAVAPRWAQDNDSNDLESAWGTRSAQTTQPTQPTQPTTASSYDASLFDESFSTLLRAGNEDCEDFAWGSGNRKQVPTAATANRDSGPSVKRPRLQASSSSTLKGAPSRIPNSAQSLWSDIRTDEEVVKCTGCHQEAKQLTVRKEGPNKGRQFYSCPKPNACKFFQWADEAAGSSGSGPATTSTAPAAPTSSSAVGWNPANTSDTSSIQCNCGAPATSFTVRKEGPNKGRPFYSCPNRDKSCGFFKWGDDDDDNQASTSAGARAQSDQSWGTQGNFTAVKNSTSSRTADAKKRKCGLCRQEGHTKQKCPRKSEFQF